MCKTQKKTFKVFILMILSIKLMLATMSCTTEPKPHFETVNLTIILNVDGNLTSNIFYLRNNENNSLIYQSELTTENIIRFSEILSGIYSLQVGDLIIEDYIRVYSENVIHNIELDPERHEFSVIRIINNTETFVDTILITDNSFNSYVDCDGGGITEPESLKKDIEKGNLVEIIVFGSQNRHIRLKGAERVYTKYEINLQQNMAVIFTEDDLHGDAIKHPTELDDYLLYDIQITVFRGRSNHFPGDHVQINSRFYFKNLSLIIDGMDIVLEYRGQLTGGTQDHSWGTASVLNFALGQTYQVTITNDHPEHHVDETLYLTFIQDIDLNVPNSLDDNQIFIRWELLPNDFQNHDFTDIMIRKSKDGVSSFFHNEMLAPHDREFTIPAGFVPSPQEDITTFHFNFMNYASSNRVSIKNSWSTHVRYLNGILQDSSQTFFQQSLIDSQNRD